jgi:hypothetical protein
LERKTKSTIVVIATAATAVTSGIVLVLSMMRVDSVPLRLLHK